MDTKEHEKESGQDDKTGPSVEFPLPPVSDTIPRDNAHAMLLETEQFIYRLQSEGISLKGA